MPLKHIRLELARDHEFPSGSRERGYEFVAPLDDDGHLVAKEWQTVRERCRVKRFWADEPADRRPRQGTGTDSADVNHNLAKVRVAGSNPVVRSLVRSLYPAVRLVTVG